MASVLTFLAMLVLSVTYATRVTITDKQIYQVIPKTEEQVGRFLGMGFSYPAVFLWSNLGKLGDPVQFMASNKDMDKFTQEVLTPMGLTTEVIYPYTRIVLDHKQILAETEDGCTPGEPMFSPPSPAHSPSWIEDAYNETVNLVPMVKIPGTGLYTGLYYKIRPMNKDKWPDAYLVKADHNGVVINWDSGMQKQYGTGGTLEKNAQWMFTPSEIPGYYQLENRAFHYPQALTAMTWAKIGGGSYNHVTVMGLDDSDPRVQAFKNPNSPDRGNALWKPTQVEDKLYSLATQKYPYGRFTTSGSYYGKSEYMCVDLARYSDSRYNKGGEWYKDLLYEFELSNVELFARMTKFELLEAPADVLNAHKKQDSSSIVAKDTLSNPSGSEITRTVENSFTKKSQFTYGFEQGFKIFTSMTVTATIPFVSASRTIGFEAELRAKQEVVTGEEKTYKESLAVKVAPYTTVVVSSYSEWVQDMSLPFNATLVISAETLRRDKDTNEDVTNSFSGAFILEYLRSKEPSYKKAKVVEVKEESLILNVRGKFTGTYGFRGVFGVKEIEKLEKPSTATGGNTGNGTLTPAQEAKRAYCNS